MLVIETGTGCIAGRGGFRGRFRPLNNKLFVLSDIVKELQASFFYFMFVFSSFTSFQAESLLVRRKVWRGNVRGRGGGGGGEDEE